MDVRQVRYFLTVVSERSVTKAAKVCHVTQPTLSAAIRRLEEECGQPLLRRLPGKVVPTSAGETLHESAAQLIAAHGRLAQIVRNIHPSNRTSLNIGALPTIAPFFPLQALSPLAHKFSNLQPVIFARTTSDLLRLLNESQLDLALVTLPLAETDCIVEELLTEELLLASPANHPLAAKEKVHGHELKNFQLVALKEGHSLTEQTHAFLRDHVKGPNIKLLADDVETLFSSVSSGWGVALVPSMARLSKQTGIVYRPIADAPTRTIAVVWKKGHQQTRIASDFISELHKTAKEFSRSKKIGSEK